MSYAEKRAGTLTGVWIAERVVSGERVRQRCATKALAVKWEAYVDATGEVPLDGTGAAHKHALGAVAKEARANRESWKRSHDTSLDQRFEVVLQFFGATSALEAVTKEKLYAFVRHLEARKGRDGAALSGKTINRYLAVVSGLLDYARECGWTSHAPKMPWQEEGEGAVEYLTQDQEDAIAVLLQEDHRACLRFLALTGLRATEFFELRSEQIDLADNRCAWVRLVGEDTKGGKGASIPVTSFDLARDVRAMIVRGVLPTHRQFYDAFKAACARLGYSADLNVHSLRHTTGTRLAKKVKPALVQHFLRHASYKTTQKYIHLADEDRLAAAEALGA